MRGMRNYAKNGCAPWPRFIGARMSACFAGWRELHFARDPGPARRRMLVEIGLDAVEDGAGELVLVGLVVEALFLVRVGDECRLDQYRGNVGRLQHGKAGLFHFALVQVVYL